MIEADQRRAVPAIPSGLLFARRVRDPSPVARQGYVLPVATRIRQQGGTSAVPCVPGREPDLSTTSDPSELRRVLGDTPDTVTQFLETLTGEQLVAEVVRQFPVRARTQNDLGVTAGHWLTHRCALLKGCNTGLAYLYAESIFVPERLPRHLCVQLEQTADPIGRVLVGHGLRLHKEPLAQPVSFPENTPNSVAEFASEIAWSRSYRLMIDGLPVFAIREWFLRQVLLAFDRQARG